MPDFYLTSKDAAEATRCGPNVYTVHDDAQCRAWLPEMEGRGKPRRYNPNQLLLLMLHSDLTRWGLSVPFAGKIVNRIAESLFFNRNADELVIEFHRNGASFFYAGERQFAGQVREDAADAAGPARFRVTFDLTAYWKEVNAAFAACGRPVGTVDAE